MNSTMTIREEACRKAFAETLVELGTEDRRIFVVTSDARGSATLSDFAERLADQFVEVGIAEQNAVSLSAGLANAGAKVFVCGPACFYSARSAEQVKNDVAYSDMPVTVVGISGGVSYGALGSTHHSLHDLALFRAIPNLSIFLPSDAVQTAAITRYLATAPGPAYMRMGRNPVPIVHDAVAYTFQAGRAELLAEGGDLTILACGETTAVAIRAVDLLRARGLEARLLEMPTIKPLDQEALSAAARETGAVLTVEEHSIHGGLGAAVAEFLSQENPVPLRILGFLDEFAPAGSSNELFAHYGITPEGLADEALRLAARKRGPVL